ncbi:MAG: serine/threonine-protein phosphatase [Leptospiraceae bacterium]|nr:serine/threonine-protein phosphatase [Leptospiraceae bacterium]MCP5502987.1 serine/threonine-protein phosphatase [Leptospiraceae bacterium]
MDDKENRNPEMFANLNDEIKGLIFPRDIKDENYEVASRIRHAYSLGGDLYSQLIDKNGNYWFAIGDASGHDLNSHLFSMMLMVQLSYYINLLETPREVSNAINHYLQQKRKSAASDITSYASLAILKADQEGNFTHYGQHPNFILFQSEEKKAEIIVTSGRFIGLEMEENRLNDLEGHFRMKKGDKLYLFTDGIFEQRNEEGKYFGYSLYQFISHHSEGIVENVADRLFQELDTFSGNKLDDDMTLMLISRK